MYNNIFIIIRCNEHKKFIMHIKKLRDFINLELKRRK